MYLYTYTYTYMYVYRYIGKTLYGTVYTVRAVAVSGEGGKGRRCQEDARAIMCVRHNAHRGNLYKRQTPRGQSRYFSRACMRNGPKYGVAGKKYPIKGPLHLS